MTAPSGPGFENHLTPEQIAEWLSLPKGTVQQIFLNEPGVIIHRRKPDPGSQRRTRIATVLRIPQSVYERVYARLTQSGPPLNS